MIAVDTVLYCKYTLDVLKFRHLSLLHSRYIILKYTNLFYAHRATVHSPSHSIHLWSAAPSRRQHTRLSPAYEWIQIFWLPSINPSILNLGMFTCKNMNLFLTFSSFLHHSVLQHFGVSYCASALFFHDLACLFAKVIRKILIIFSFKK